MVSNSQNGKAHVKMSRKPGFFLGAPTYIGVSAMLTVALIAVFLAGLRLAGLPFVSFDVFDWISRVLPGRVTGLGIGTMVAAIRALHVGPTSVVAKHIEQAMGIAGLFYTGVAADAIITSENRQKLVPIGGIAHAGARGISKVELQVDNPELASGWQKADLLTPLSDLTWVIWRYNWPFESGEHTFTVRCWDGADAPQIVTPQPADHSGATGLYTTRKKL
jgi:hypothetical protein